MGTLLAVLIGGALAVAYLRNQRQARLHRERHRWDPPAGQGVIQLQRPFSMGQQQWNKVLSDHKAAGWCIVASNPLVNQMTLEK